MTMVYCGLEKGYVFLVKAIRDMILREAHESAYSIHPGSTKMYVDLKQKYWWYGLKRDVAECCFV